MDKIPILLLAAGSSSRMGSPKQLLPWGNQTLIEHQIETLLKTENPVNVVLGAKSKLILPIIEKYEINIFINSNWKNGMGSSISYGIRQVGSELPNTQGILMTLLDQPLMTSKHIQNLINEFQVGNKQILASKDASGWLGVPALFDRFYFEKLLQLKGEEGAKKIIQKYKSAVKSFQCGELLEDIDTPESYEKLLRKTLHNSTE